MDAPPSQKLRTDTLRIVAIYAMFGFAWIYGSDTAAGWLIQDHALIVRIAVAKGFLFIICTSAILYFLINRFLKQITSAEKGRIENLKDYQTVFNATNEAILILDARSGDILDANDQMLEMFGYGSAEVLAADLGQFSEGVSPYSRVELDEYLHKALQEEAQVFQWLYRKKSGDILWAEVSLRCITMHGDDRIIAVVRDINERKQQDDAIRANEKRHRTILQTALSGFWRTDMQGNILEVNSSYCRMSGYAEPELLQMNIGDLEINEATDDVVASIKAIVASGEARFDSRHRRKDGAIFDVEVSVKFLPVDGGQCVAFLRDITERKQAEKAIRDRERYIETILENAPIGFAVNTMHDGKGVFVGGKFEDIYGVPRNSIHTVGEYFEKVYLDPVLREEIRSRIMADMESGDASRMRWEDIPIRTASGEQRFVTAINIPLFDQGLMVSTVQDVTARHKAEESLRRSKRFTEILNRISRSFLTKTSNEEMYRDVLGVVMDIMGSPLGVFGYINREEELSCQTMAQSDLSCAEGDKIIIFPGNRWSDTLWGKSLKKGESFYSNKPFAVPHGHLPIDRHLSVPLLFQKKPIGLIMVANRVHDYTDFDLELIKQIGEHISPVLNAMLNRQWSEEEREKIQSQLLQSQKLDSIGQLAGGIAHDFNNYLTVILHHTQLAMMTINQAEPIHANLEEIAKAAERSADLTKQLLAFARKQIIVPRVLDLNETVESILKILRRLIGEDIDLVWQPSNNLWRVMIDPSQIDQILANLCVNARDAIVGVGKITISTGNITLDHDYCAANPGLIPGEYLLLTVSDDGCGMDKETMSHVFEPFFTIKSVGEGTGLGLATVYGIVKQNNGLISLWSEPDHGATFMIYLPRCDAEIDCNKGEELPKPLLRGHETVLVVEDEQSILDVTVTLIQMQGYRVLAARTPEEAISIAEGSPDEIHLLITDVVMPGMNGRDLFDNLQRIHPDMRCIFMSGYTADIVANKGVLEENLNFIAKPFPIPDLMTKMREVLDKG
jgi:PAS domain S-box-containing protein